MDFFDQIFCSSEIDPNAWKAYLKALTSFYNGDISFRLLFDYHWQRDVNYGWAGIRKYYSGEAQGPIFVK